MQISTAFGVGGICNGQHSLIFERLTRYAPCPLPSPYRSTSAAIHKSRTSAIALAVGPQQGRSVVRVVGSTLT
jgi:hypothetical protein